MDLQNMDLKGGSLQISTEVIGKIARCLALEVDGVSEVSCGKQNKRSRSRWPPPASSPLLPWRCGMAPQN